MRVKLDFGGISPLDENRGMGVYAEQMRLRLPRLVEVVGHNQDLTHYLVFKLFAPRPLLLPAVVTVHDLIPLKYPKAYPLGIRGRWRWRQNKKFLRRANGIITDSQASKRDIIKFTGIDSDKILVVYLAAKEIFRPVKAVNKFGLPDKFVLYVGDLNWNKNVVSLAKTCLKLDYPLVVVGRQAAAADFDARHPENQELVEFQSLAKINPRQIICMGAISQRDLVMVYNLATIYAQSSRDEGFGLPVLEAMACGCPVLSSEQGSLPEITGKAALKLSPANLKLLWNSQRLRRQFSQLGLSQAKRFSWDKTVKATVLIYEKVIADRVNR
jgi:glycosyltransferase involved in cell wall biosynthesis